MTRPAPTCRHCGQVVKRGQLMCRNHWFALPRPMRRAICAAARARRFRAYVAGLREAERWLRGSDDAEAME